MKDADAMKQTPITIAVASTKGGSGKSSMTAALAVQAAKEGGRVAIFDWEPQGSLTLWWIMRGKPDNPRLIQDDIPPEAARRKLAGERDWLFLDTAPAIMDQVELAVEAADFVLIPVLASAFDLVATRGVVSLCQEQAKSLAFVINRKNPRRELLHSSTAKHLCRLGLVLDEHVHDRTAYVAALNKGLTGPEHPDARQAREARSPL